MLALFFGAFAAITSAGKLDFFGWPRVLQYGAAALACLSFTVLMLGTVFLDRWGNAEFIWAQRLFSPWAAYMVPLVVALLGLLWLNSDWLGFPIYLLRSAFGIMPAIAILSNILFAVEGGRIYRHKADEHDRDATMIIEKAASEQDLARLLVYTNKSERPPIRELALAKIRTTGPRFNTLMAECLRNGNYPAALAYVRDYDPPADPAPLAEPARDAILRDVEHIHEVGRRDFVASDVDTALTVADKFSKYRVDFVPAVRNYRAALAAPSYQNVAPSVLRKLDKWLAARAK